MNQQERQALVSYFEKEYFALENGMRLTRVEPGRACGEMEAGKRHLNANGVVMGGALFTLGDLVLAAAANSHGTLAVSTDCDIRFLRPAPAGRIRAEARELKKGRRLGVYTVDITDGAGVLCARMTGSVLREDTPVPGWHSEEGVQDEKQILPQGD